MPTAAPAAVARRVVQQDPRAVQGPQGDHLLPSCARSHRLGHLAVVGEHEAHDLVGDVGGRLEHQRAATVDDGDAVLTAIHRGVIADAAFTEGTVHPGVLDAELGALAHRPLGRLRLGGDHDRVDAAGDVAQVVVAPVAFDLV